MISFHRLMVANFLLYKKRTVFEFSPGLSVIYGKNKNTKSGEASNGSGKSLLFSALPLLLFSTTPLNSNKRELKSTWVKGMEITLEFSLDDTKYLVHKFCPKKGKVELHIYKDGTDQSFATITEAQKYLDSLIPFTEEEFFSLIFIDSSRLSSFVFGTATERHNFVRNIFRLNEYATIHSSFKETASELRASLKNLSYLQSEIETLQSLGIESTDLDKDYHKLRGKFEKLSSELELIPGKKQQLVTAKSFAKLSDRIQEKLEELNFPESDNLLTQVKQKAARLKKLQKDIIAFERRNEEFSKWSKRKNKLADALKKALVTFGDIELPADIAVDLSDYSNKRLVTSISKVVSNILDLQANIKNLRKTLEKAPATKLPSRKSVEKDIRENNEVLYHLRQEMKDSASLCSSLKALKGESTCPTCLRPLIQKDVEKVLAAESAKQRKAQPKIETIEAELEKLEAILGEIDEQSEYLKYKDQLKDYEKALKSYGLMGKNKETLDLLDSYANLCSEYQSHSKQEVEDPGEPPKVSLSPDKLTDLYSELSLLAKLVEEKEELGGNLTSPPKGNEDKELEKLGQREDELSSQLHSISQQLGQLKLQIDQVAQNSSKYEQLQVEFKSIRKQSIKLPVYEALEKAYSPKGLQYLMVQELGKHLEKALNTYAPFIYREPFKFELEVTAREFYIWAHRNGKRSDVKMLSGAERRMFTLLLVFAFLGLIDPSRRTNILVLDEPTANLDSAYREAFINDFLTLLRSSISSVVVITPLTEEIYPDARLFQAIKKGSVTQLSQLA